MRGNDRIKIYPLAITRVISVSVDLYLVPLNELIITLIEPSCRHLHHLLREVTHNKNWAVLLA